MPNSVVYAVMLLVTGIACVTDVRTGLIPNRVTLPILALAPLAHGCLHGWSGVSGSLLGLVACSVMPYVFFKVGAMGGGDVKLFAGLGALGGAELGLDIQLLSLLGAFAWGLCAAAHRGQLGRLLASSFWTAVNLLLPAARRRPIEHTQMTMMRIGGAILAGTVLAIGGRALSGGHVL